MLRLLVIPQPAFYTIVSTCLRCFRDGDGIALSRANSSRVSDQNQLLVLVATAAFLRSDDGAGCEDPRGRMQEGQPAAF